MGTQEVACENCAIKFVKLSSDIKKTRANFCSKSCAAKVNNRRRPSLKGKTKFAVCAVCSVECLVGVNSAIFNCAACRKDLFAKKRRRQRTNARLKLGPLNCLVCSQPLASALGKYCLQHQAEKHSERGRKSIAVQKAQRRSKNEMVFASLCKEMFRNVGENEPIFDGWDADVILYDYKVAILWNGAWHFKKITKAHNVLMVQNRDKIKLRNIQQANFSAYVVEDRGAHSPKFVVSEFEKFLVWLAKQNVQAKLNYISPGS